MLEQAVSFLINGYLLVYSLKIHACTIYRKVTTLQELIEQMMSPDDVACAYFRLTMMNDDSWQNAVTV